MSAQSSGTPLTVPCSFCGNRIATQENLTTDSNGDPFCNECVMNVDCVDCGRTLTLTKKRVAELGDEIVCLDCDTESTEEETMGTLDWIGLYLAIGFGLGVPLLLLNEFLGQPISDSSLGTMLRLGTLLVLCSYAIHRAYYN